MKKLLIISYAYPPVHSIGAVRLASLVRHLPRYGWKPYVVTVKPGKWIHDDISGAPNDTHGEVCRTTAVDLKKIITKLFGRAFRSGGVTRGKAYASRKFSPARLALGFYDNILAFPDSAWPWYFLGRRRALEFARKIEPDAILSSSPPETCHIIASYVQKKTGIPWIAELRDLWSQSIYKDSSPLERRWMQRLEKKILKNASTLCTVTAQYADNLRELHNKPTFVVTNGFEPSEFASPQHLMDRFTLVYTGMLYAGKRDPALLFKAVGSLIKEEKISPDRFRILFCGPDHDITLTMARKAGIADYVESYSLVSRERALELQKQAHLLLQLEWTNPKAKGVAPGKFFEYLGSGRPILAIGPRGGVIDSILQRAGHNGVLSSAEEIKAFLKRAIAEPNWAQRNSSTLDPSQTLLYTREKQAAAMAKHLALTTRKFQSQAG